MKLNWIILFFYLPAFTQERFEVNYLIKFNDTFKPDSAEIRRHNGVLRIDGQKSLFYMAAIDKNPLSTPETTRVLDTTFLVMTDSDKEELCVFEFSFDSGFLWVSDSLHPMKWEMDSSSKKVGELNCFKATCSFRGRNYTAWFSPDIPISKGPWKMGGLPGLIVELFDEDRILDVSFVKMTNGTKLVKIPTPKMNWNDFVKLRKKSQEDFAASLRAEQKSDCLTCRTEISAIHFEALEKY